MLRAFSYPINKATQALLGKTSVEEGVGGKEIWGWRTKGTRLADFGMLKYCQLMKKCFLSEGQEDEERIQITKNL